MNKINIRSVQCSLASSSENKKQENFVPKLSNAVIASHFSYYFYCHHNQ